MEEIANPYIAGAPVTEKRMFFGREDVFDWIQRSLSGQYTDHILVVHGQRRVGKTSVLKQLGNRLPDRYIPVFFDLQGRTHTTLDRFMWWVAREIVHVLNQKREIPITPPDKEQFAQDPDFFENRFLVDIKPILGEDRVLLLTFDEFDNLEEGEVKNILARPLIDHLRRLMEHSSLNFIFSIGSSGRKLENMQAAYTEFFKAALYKKISFLTKDDSFRLITLPVQGIIEYDTVAVQQIYETVSGHPYFTQLVCHELFSQCQKTGQRTISRVDVEGILDDVVERGTVNLKFVWDEASDLEKWALSGLAQLEGSRDNRGLADFLIHQRVRFNQQSLDSALLHLREKDVLTEENLFINHLLHIWMKKNRPIEQAREELTEVNPIANRYIEIGLEYKLSGLADKAIESFKEALDIDSDNLQAQVNLALVYLDQKNFDKSISEFEKALLIDDEDIATRSGLCDAYLALGDQLQARGRLRDAMLPYQKILVINSEHNEARQRMAEISRQLAEKALLDNKNEEALNAFSEALKFTPEDPNLISRVEQVRAEKKAKVLAAQIARAEKEANARNWEKAISALNEALETSLNDETILKKITFIKERQLKERLDGVLAKADQGEKASRWDTAIAALNEYLSLNPSDALIQKRLNDLISAKHSAWLNGIITRADQAVAYQNWDEAITALNEVLAREPENTEIQKKVAKVREIRRIAELNALLKRVEVALQASQWDEAINDLNNGVAFDPENESLQVKLIEIRKAKREARIKAALRLVDSATQSSKWDAAIEGLNEILAIEPDNSEILQKLAIVKKGQHESKLKSLQTQARGFSKLDKFDESLAAWNEYLALDPDDREKALAQIESVKKAQGLARIYAEANKAFSEKNYENAIGLFKSIVVENTDYKDASHLLAESIELRRATRKWWKSKWLLGGGGVLIVLLIGWFALQPRAPLMEEKFLPTEEPITINSSATPEENASDAIATIALSPTVPPTAAPTPLPLAWARLNSGQFLPRDTITTIVFDPADSGVMYIGTDKAGLFKSIDGGLSWQPSSAGLERTWIYSHVIDPQDPKVQYVATLLGGVFKSLDSGANWTPITKNLSTGWEWTSIVVIDPSNSQHLYYTQASQIFESINGGTSWQEIHNNETCPDQIVGLIAHPNDSNILYSSHVNLVGNNCDTGIYASTDGGHNWTFISAPLPAPGKIWGSFERWNLALGGLKSETLFAYDGQFLFRSSDNGSTWKGVQAPNCSAIAMDPKNGLSAFCTDKNFISQSVDGGESWAAKGRIDIKQSTNQTLQSISVSPISSDTVLVGGAGIWLSNDSGRAFEARNSGLAAVSSEIGIDSSDPSALLVRIGDTCDFYRSTDGAQTWEKVADHSCYLGISTAPSTKPINQNPDSLVIHPSIPEKYFAVYGRENPPYIYISNDGGKNWHAAAGMGSISDGKLFFDQDQGKRVYAVGDMDTYRSDDAGETWKTCTGTNSFSARSLSRMIVDPLNADHLTLATRGNGILVSKDGCQTWHESNNGLGSLFVNTLVSDTKNPDTIYAGTDGGGYISTDSGQTWGQVNDGLLGATVIYSLLVDNHSTILATTPYGIFKLEKK